MECFVCKKTNFLVTCFPISEKQLDTWKKTLKLNCENKQLKNKKLCIRHFPKQHHMVLLNPNYKRGKFVHPVSDTLNDEEIENNVNDDAKRQKLEENEINKNQNYEVLIAEKDKKIINLETKIKELQEINSKIKKQLKECQTIKHAKTMINNDENTTSVARSLINIILNKRHLFSDQEKQVCQNFYAKFPGAYKYLKNLLGNVLPNRRTLTRWHKFKALA